MDLGQGTAHVTRLETHLAADVNHLFLGQRLLPWFSRSLLHLGGTAHDPLQVPGGDAPARARAFPVSWMQLFHVVVITAG